MSHFARESSYSLNLVEGAVETEDSFKNETNPQHLRIHGLL